MIQTRFSDRMVHGVKIGSHQQKLSLLIGCLEIRRMNPQGVKHNSIFPRYGPIKTHAGLLEGLLVLFD